MDRRFSESPPPPSPSEKLNYFLALENKRLSVEPTPRQLDIDIDDTICIPEHIFIRSLTPFRKSKERRLEFIKIHFFRSRNYFGNIDAKKKKE